MLLAAFLSIILPAHEEHHLRVLTGYVLNGVLQ